MTVHRNIGIWGIWLLVFTGLAGLAGLASAPAFATVGKNEASVEADRQNIAGVRHASVSKGSYTIHEIANRQVTIREYGAGGTIFAVSWSGVRHPDLIQVLGGYYQDYEEASRNAARIKGRRSSARIQGRDIVVEKWGHMRWLQGRAYVPRLLPADVKADDLK